MTHKGNCRAHIGTLCIVEKWRIASSARANIFSIFKKIGKETDNNGQLDITTWQNLSKFIKQLVHEHLEKNILFSRSQHGFIKKKLCLVNLFFFSDGTFKLTLEIQRT